MPSGPSSPFRFRHLALGDVGSTNDEARARLHYLRDGPFVVSAERQLSGRGRRGRAWVSPRGNVYASFVFRPEAPLGRFPELSFVAALAVSDMARGIVERPDAVRCKWPNDVLIDGAKLSGILLETASTAGGDTAVVAGIGVNVASRPDDTPYLATALSAHCASIDADAALEALSESLAGWIARWADAGFGVVRAAWLNRADGLNERLVARLSDRELAGTFADLAEDGSLVLETDAGDMVRIAAADVFRPAAQS